MKKGPHCARFFYPQRITQLFSSGEESLFSKSSIHHKASSPKVEAVSSATFHWRSLRSMGGASRKNVSRG